MKLLIRKIIILGIWFLVFVVTSIWFALQSNPIGHSLINRLLQGALFCSVPYIFFTTFYVMALIARQYRKVIYLFIIDVISSITIVINIRYFYEGPLVARNSLLVIIGLILIKVIVLVTKQSRSDGS